MLPVIYFQKLITHIFIMNSPHKSTDSTILFLLQVTFQNVTFILSQL